MRALVTGSRIWRSYLLVFSRPLHCASVSTAAAPDVPPPDKPRAFPPRHFPFSHSSAGQVFSHLQRSVSHKRVSSEKLAGLCIQIPGPVVREIRVAALHQSSFHRPRPCFVVCACPEEQI